MRELIVGIRNALAHENYENEGSITNHIVFPILQQLGWDPTDRSRVKPFFAAGSGFVDLALIDITNEPCIFIEVKQPIANQNLKSRWESQLEGYVNAYGVDLAVLTTGLEWHVYLPGARGDFRNKLVQTVSLMSDPPEAVDEALQDLIGYSTVMNKRHLTNAFRRWDEIQRSVIIKRAIPRIWADMLRAPDIEIARRLSDSVERLVHIKLTDDEVAAFLAAQVPGLAKSKFSPGPRANETLASTHMFISNPVSTPTADISQLAETALAGKTHKEPRTRIRSVTILGQTFPTPAGGTQAFRKVLEVLTGADPQFMQILGRHHPTLASENESIFIDERTQRRKQRVAPAFDGSTWWVNFNFSTSDMVRNIFRASELAGLVPGTDVLVEVDSGR